MPVRKKENLVLSFIGAEFDCLNQLSSGTGKIRFLHFKGQTYFVNDIYDRGIKYSK